MSRQPAANAISRAQRDAVQTAARRGASLVSLGFAAPCAWDVAALWDEENDAVLWHPSGDTAFAGLGVARALSPRGEGRFGALRAEAAAVLSEVEVLDGGRGPRLFGGVAFAPGDAEASPWGAFGDARFVLPRWTYRMGDGDASLHYVGPPDDALFGELDVLRRRLRSVRPPALTLRLASLEHLSFGEYAAGLDRILRTIQAGEVEKVALARRVDLVFDRGIEPRAVLARLRERFRGCTRFAMRTRGDTFLGATPERLVERCGTSVRSEALAGSVARGGANAMLESPKEQREHRLVVNAIVDALRPFCDSLDVASAPTVRELPDVLHLQTPIAGRLRGDTSVLSLAEALHPTPAVGGVPRGRSLDLIAREPSARGWYASPFGWTDASGDGELVVGLRSGLLRGRRAHAWAGGGIVAGSRAQAEYDEGTLKLRAMLWALGALDGPSALLQDVAAPPHAGA